MSAPVPGSVTEREAVLREREAYRAGIAAERAVVCERMRIGKPMPAAERYPLPKVTRPRVVRERDGEVEWTLIGGQLHWRWTREGNAPWMAGPRGVVMGDVTPAMARAWDDLFTTPTETVDDDGGPR